MKPGDQVTVTVLPAKNGKPIGRIVEVVLPNGHRLAGRGLTGPTKIERFTPNSEESRRPIKSDCASAPFLRY